MPTWHVVDIAVAFMNINDDIQQCTVKSPYIKLGYIHCESKKLDPFSFEHNFGKYCPILIILSLLQTEINYDKVYQKIYHHT